MAFGKPGGLASVKRSLLTGACLPVEADSLCLVEKDAVRKVGRVKGRRGLCANAVTAERAGREATAA